jgi:hypothetical protein
MAQVMDYSERLMRAALLDLPGSEGAFEDLCDGDGIADDPAARMRNFASVSRSRRPRTG